jgi:photosystem II stability/assembly factor-like uncharacterized protein
MGNSRSNSAPMLFLAATAALLSAQSRVLSVTRLEHGTPTFFSDREGWAPGSGEAIWRTVDGGQTWSRINIGNAVDIGPRAELRGPYFQSASEVWAVRATGGDLPWSSTRSLTATFDGGKTWKKESVPAAGGTLESLFSGGQGGPLWLGGIKAYDSDGPAKELDCPQRVLGTVLVPVVFFRATPNSAWEQQRLPFGNGCPFSTMTFLDRERGVAIAGMAIMFTTDQGRHWQRSIVRGSPGSVPTSPPLSLSFRDNDGWIGCDHGEILNSTDGGETWQEFAKPGTIWSRARGFGMWGATFFTGRNTGFNLGGDGELFETRDRGETWRKVDVPERMTGLSCSRNRCWVVSAEELYRIEETR